MNEAAELKDGAQDQAVAESQSVLIAEPEMQAVEFTRYSQGTGCFYPVDIEYAALPGDLVAVPMEDYIAASMRGPADRLEFTAGRVIVVAGDPTEGARRAEVLGRLAEIDAASGRPSREIALALAAGSSLPEYAVAKLAALESEAGELRAELARL